MRKKCFLALLLAVSLLLSGCALVTVDEQADNARVVLDVNGEKVTKGVLNNAVDYQLSQNEQMNYYYQLFGLSGTYSTDRATVQSQVVDSYINTLVAQQKAKELGFDQLTAEEEEAVQKTAEENYHSFLDQVSEYYFPNSELSEEEKHTQAEEYAKEHGLATLEDALESAKQEKALEKLRADAVKDVAVSEEEIAAALQENADSAKTTYASNPSAYGSAVNNGTTVYYAPAGYRFVKQILVKFAEADSQAITEKNTALTEANTALTEAQTALDNAAEDADKTALQAAVDAAQEKVDSAQAALNGVTDAAYANIQEKTDEIYAKATAEDADFDALVTQYNEDTGMPAVGYAVCEGYSYFVESFTQAAMALEKVGDISEPVKSSYGYHILQYSAEIPEGTVALDTVRDTLQASLLSQKQSDAYNAALEGWVAAADVKTYLDRMN